MMRKRGFHDLRCENDASSETVAIRNGSAIGSIRDQLGRRWSSVIEVRTLVAVETTPNPQVN
jgi:hypothetical protein